MNWDDFRYVLALGRSGTLAGAANTLGVHYTSVARRIAQTEEAMGTRLFDHGRRDHPLTPAGEELMQVAERIENEVFALDRELLGKDARLGGPLRVAMTPWMAVNLAKDLARFAELHPDIELQTTVAFGHHNLTRREADVTIRITNSPPETLVGRRVATMRLAGFAAESLIERMGDRPLSEWPWVKNDPKLGPTMGREWLDEHAEGWGAPFTIDDYYLAGNLLIEGVLASYSSNGVDRLYPHLRRVTPWLAFAMGLWVLTHPDLRNTARVRAFMTFIAPCVKALYPPVDDQALPEGLA